MILSGIVTRIRDGMRGKPIGEPRLKARARFLDVSGRRGLHLAAAVTADNGPPAFPDQLEVLRGSGDPCLQRVRLRPARLSRRSDRIPRSSGLGVSSSPRSGTC